MKLPPPIQITRGEAYQIARNHLPLSCKRDFDQGKVTLLGHIMDGNTGHLVFVTDYRSPSGKRRKRYFAAFYDPAQGRYRLTRMGLPKFSCLNPDGISDIPAVVKRIVQRTAARKAAPAPKVDDEEVIGQKEWRVTKRFGASTVDPLPPWHPNRLWLHAREVPLFLKRMIGLTVSIARINKWIHEGVKHGDGRIFLKARRFNGCGLQLYINKADLIAFMEYDG